MLNGAVSSYYCVYRSCCRVVVECVSNRLAPVVDNEPTSAACHLLICVEAYDKLEISVVELCVKRVGRCCLALALLACKLSLAVVACACNALECNGVETDAVRNSYIRERECIYVFCCLCECECILYVISEIAVICFCVTNEATSYRERICRNERLLIVEPCCELERRLVLVCEHDCSIEVAALVDLSLNVCHKLCVAEVEVRKVCDVRLYGACVYHLTVYFLLLKTLEQNA